MWVLIEFEWSEAVHVLGLVEQIFEGMRESMAVSKFWRGGDIAYGFPPLDLLICLVLIAEGFRSQMSDHSVSQTAMGSCCKA